MEISRVGTLKGWQLWPSFGAIQYIPTYRIYKMYVINGETDTITCLGIFTSVCLYNHQWTLKCVGLCHPNIVGRFICTSYNSVFTTVKIFNSYVLLSKAPLGYKVKLTHIRMLLIFKLYTLTIQTWDTQWDYVPYIVIRAYKSLTAFITELVYRVNGIKCKWSMQILRLW